MLRAELSEPLAGLADATSSTVTLSLGSLLSLTRPDHTTLVVTHPVFTHAFNLTAFEDGILFVAQLGPAGIVSVQSNETLPHLLSADDNRCECGGCDGKPLHNRLSH